MARNGLSEAETARRLQIAQSALNRITHRGLPPTLTTAAKIVSAFDGQINYDDLMTPATRRLNRRLRGKLVA